MTSWLTVCIYTPHLMIDIAQMQRPATRPLAIAVADSDRAPIIDCDSRALQAGVEIGMSVLKARRLCRSLEIRTPDRTANADVATQIAAIVADQADDVRRDGARRWTGRALALGHAYRAAPA